MTQTLHWLRLFRKALRCLIIAAFLGAFFFAIAAKIVWDDSQAHTIDSVHLQEQRSYRVFGSGNSNEYVYSFDGQSFRNGLFPATMLRISSWIGAWPDATFVAIYSNANRDVDFRPQHVEPTYWRPSISGRSDIFDSFLIEELFPEVEGNMDVAKRRHLFGHSLAGLYVIDLASRHPDLMAGVYAFSPTFSHDQTILDRLPNVCAGQTDVYANWGLESERDTKVFQSFTREWLEHPGCQERSLTIRRHFGVVHAAIMSTGQAEVIFLPESPE